MTDSDPRLEWYQDDRQNLADLIKAQWSLGPQETPLIYCNEQGTARRNQPGSIYIYYSTDRTYERISVNYDAVRSTVQMTLNVQNPGSSNGTGDAARRHERWMRELIRILNENRRYNAGIKGWDYLDIRSVRDQNVYINYFVTNVEVKLTIECKPIVSTGFGS